MRKIFAIAILGLSIAITAFANDCNLVVENGIKAFVTHIQENMIVAVHGGLSSMEESYRFCKRILQIAPPNYGIISVDYSLSPLGGKEVEDVVLVANYLKKKKVKHIGLIGESHGAYIALLAGLYIKPDFVIDISGPTDMTAMYAHFKAHPEIFKNWLQIVEITKRGCLQKDLDPKTCLVKISPVSYAGFMDYPILIIHGNLDNTVPINQSLILFEKLLKFKNQKVWFLSTPEDHKVDFTREPLKTLIQSFIEQYGGANGLSGSNSNKKEHTALPEQTRRKGKD